MSTVYQDWDNLYTQPTKHFHTDFKADDPEPSSRISEAE